MSSKPNTLKERIERRSREKKAREAENAELRAVLKLAEPVTLETFGLHAPQGVRDQMAASAFIKERLNIVAALRRLGFKIDDHNLAPTRATLKLAAEIFGTPGCQAILMEIVSTEVAPTTDALIARLKQSAFSDDDKVSTTAASVLAKLMGLNKEKSVVNVDARSQSIFLIGQKGATREAIDGGPKELEAGDFLNHEPAKEGEKIFEVAEGT